MGSKDVRVLAAVGITPKILSDEAILPEDRARCSLTAGYVVYPAVSTTAALRVFREALRVAYVSLKGTAYVALNWLTILGGIRHCN